MGERREELGMEVAGLCEKVGDVCEDLPDAHGHEDGVRVWSAAGRLGPASGREPLGLRCTLP